MPSLPNDNAAMLERFNRAWEQLLDTSRTGSERGRCFENAWRFVFEKGEFEGQPLLLCHGDVENADGLRHPHAWVEWGDGVGMVFDPSNGEGQALMATLPEYYLMGKVHADQVQRYTRKAAMICAAATETYGPWTREESE